MLTHRKVIIYSLIAGGVAMIGTFAGFMYSDAHGVADAGLEAFFLAPIMAPVGFGAGLAIGFGTLRFSKVIPKKYPWLGTILIFVPSIYIVWIAFIQK